ncbi:IMP dehydrogenase [Candidatus Borreliella tachyglossi]
MKIGIGSVSIYITRIVAGIEIPQITATFNG